MLTPVSRHLSVHLAAGMLILASAAVFSGCSGEEEVKVAVVPVVPPPPPPPAPQPAKEKPVYVYSGDRYRDPFVPSGQTGGYSTDAVFDPTKVAVKGIIFGGAQKTAVLTTGGGLTYFVKNSKIFDIMGKPVEGFTAKVLTEKVVINDDGGTNTFELKIRNTQEDKAL